MDRIFTKSKLPTVHFLKIKMDSKPFKDKGVYVGKEKKKKGYQNKTIRKSEQLEVRIIRKDWFVLFGRRKEMT